MDDKNIVVTIVNSHYPPSKAITGESAHELASYLVNVKKIKVRIIHTDTDYFGGGAGNVPKGDIIKIKGFHNRKNKYTRLVSSFYESFLLVRKAGKYSDGPIIIMTDPPFLVLWASVFLKKKTWFYWSMDLYPEAFVSGNLISKNNLLYRIFKYLIKRNSPELLIALGSLQYDYLLKEYFNNVPGIILPCGISEQNNASELPHWKTDQSIYLGYCGNIGEAHSQRFILDIIDNLDVNRFTLVLSLYGSKSSEILSYAEGKQGIKILKHVPRNELRFIDIHLVSLLKEWNHVCVPSKAVSAVCVGGSILFCGTENNDNWNLLQDAGWFIKETEDIRRQVIIFFAEFSEEELVVKKRNAARIANQLRDLKHDSFEEISIYANKSLSIV